MALKASLKFRTSQQEALRKVMAVQAVRERFAARSLDMTYLKGAAFSAYMQKDADWWKQVIKVSGANIE